ncbi:hypothetical protein V6N13_083540 [Hibiscus sabdariffa]
MSDLVFFTKLSSLFWIKTTKFAVSFEESRWWENPQEAWDAPSSSGLCLGSIKFSVDGAAGCNLAGCGGALREATGNIRIMFFGPIDPLGSDYAEVMQFSSLLTF